MIKAIIHAEHWLPRRWSKVAGFEVAGITLGKHIYLRDPQSSYSLATGEGLGDETARLLRHEQTHVEQWAELGRVRFAAIYCADFLRAWWRLRDRREAYLAIRFEQEARRCERAQIPWQDVGLYRDIEGWRMYSLHETP